jgi:hypothetical protein
MYWTYDIIYIRLNIKKDLNMFLILLFISRT